MRKHPSMTDDKKDQNAPTVKKIIKKGVKRPLRSLHMDTLQKRMQEHKTRMETIDKKKERLQKVRDRYEEEYQWKLKEKAETTET